MECPACSSTNVEIIEYFDEDEDSQNHYAVYECEDCGYEFGY